MDTQVKRLYRSRSERMVAGVCGGLAEYFKVDPTMMRLLFVLAAFLTGFIPALLFYLVVMVLVPEAPLAPPDVKAPPQE
jgi:phage shock protein C